MPSRLEFVITRHIPNETDATDQVVFIAPYNCQLVSVESRQRVASSSGTMDVKKADNAEALSSGDSLLTATMSLAGTANTKVAGSLAANPGILKGQALGLDFGGTLTSLEDLDVTIRLRRTGL